jgi:hypothetical protein
MKARVRLGLVVALIFLCPTACGMKVMTSGRVVDAGTGLPVEGAAVAIKWVHYKWGPPGLPTPKKRLGTTETLTDAQGGFTIPRYIWRSHYMGVYKEGYICWTSETRFNPYGSTYEEMFERRFWHRVNDGMIIQLEPMPKDTSFELRRRHACFTGSVGTRLESSNIFSKATRHEDDLCFRK